MLTRVQRVRAAAVGVVGDDDVELGYIAGDFLPGIDDGLEGGRARCCVGDGITDNASMGGVPMVGAAAVTPFATGGDASDSGAVAVRVIRGQFADFVVCQQARATDSASLGVADIAVDEEGPVRTVQIP